jgi:hypothetical protein
VTDTALSRASPLPHLIRFQFGIWVSVKSS